MLISVHTKPELQIRSSEASRDGSLQAVMEILGVEVGINIADLLLTLEDRGERIPI